MRTLRFCGWKEHIRIGQLAWWNCARHITIGSVPTGAMPTFFEEQGFRRLRRLDASQSERPPGPAADTLENQVGQGCPATGLSGRWGLTTISDAHTVLRAG